MKLDIKETVYYTLGGLSKLDTNMMKSSCTRYVDKLSYRLGKNRISHFP